MQNLNWILAKDVTPSDKGTWKVIHYTCGNVVVLVIYFLIVPQ